MGKKIKRIIKTAVAVLVILIVAAGVFMMSVNMHVQNSTKDRIAAKLESYDEGITDEELKELKALDADCILVLGCGILDYETPTPMLEDRLLAGLYLYRQGVAPKILLSGDNGTLTHNEIHVMLKYMKDAGVPDEDIFCDHAGFSTYDSVYRAKSIFQVQKAVLVTQTYHLYRALYLADKMDIQALGVSSDQKTYAGQASREIREVLARDKDFFKVRSGAGATGGEVIPITGSGVISHGE